MVANLIYVTVSTGIGGGAITDGRPFAAAEEEWLPISDICPMLNGELCPCGNRGCFEAYGSGTAFTRRARARAMACDETTLGAKGSEIHSCDVFAAARNGDDLQQTNRRGGRDPRS